MSDLKNIKFLILGAGPTGLSLAHSLVACGVPLNEIVVIEKESTVGGLCRSAIVDGYPVDIGGGHFLDTKRKSVLNFLFNFMPEIEWNIFDRISKINIHNIHIDYPIESNLWQLPLALQADYLDSLARADSSFSKEMPKDFSKWVTWKLGEMIANNYMIPYNNKIWSMDLSTLGTYWLYKLPDVNFKEAILSCLMGKPFGTLPAHSTFLYPKIHGYGEVWRRMGCALEDSLILDTNIDSIDINDRVVNGRWKAESIISTIPWNSWLSVSELPSQVVFAIKNLKKISIDVDYFPETLESNAHWIYEPNEKFSYHRKLLRSNFCLGSPGYWTETNSARRCITSRHRFINDYAYPVNTIDKIENVEIIEKWSKSCNIYGIGRWGKWEHMNSDVCVEEAIKFAEFLTS
jgi:protoporphyrinogen oxidase